MESFYCVGKVELVGNMIVLSVMGQRIIIAINGDINKTMAQLAKHWDIAEYRKLADKAGLDEKLSRPYTAKNTLP